MKGELRLAAVSIDLDEIDCYAAIHGLESPSGKGAIYERAVPRFEEFFSKLGIPATYFVIGKDLSSDAARRAVLRLHEAGNEIACHSMNHLYDLSRQPEDVMRREIRDGADAIQSVTGWRPSGFRAPGYTINDALFSILTKEGFEYDSSVFPCPAYYAAKTAAIGWIAARGRTSRSVVDDPRVLTAPAEPYRIGTPYWKRGTGLVELPIGVTRDITGRLPFIGTSIALGGDRVARSLARMCEGRSIVSLELHGIDLADAREDGLEWLAPHQPDLRKSAAQKRMALEASISELMKAGYSFVRCDEAARQFASATAR